MDYQISNMRKLFFCSIMISLAFCSTGQLKKGYEINVSIPNLLISQSFSISPWGQAVYKLTPSVSITEDRGISQEMKNCLRGYMIVLRASSISRFFSRTTSIFRSPLPIQTTTTHLNSTDQTKTLPSLPIRSTGSNIQRQAGSLSRRAQNNRQNSASLKILTEMHKKRRN